jgi:hypothetical protein
MRGKLTKKAIYRAAIDPSAVMRDKVQKLHTDVMHLDGHKFLVTLVKPLQVTLQILLKNVCKKEIYFK